MPRQAKPWFWKARKLWYVQLNGKRVNLGPDKGEAHRKFYAILAEPPKAKATVAPDSFASIADQFLDWTLNNRAKSTYDFYRDKIERFVVFSPPLTLESIQPFHVQRWINTLGDSNTYRRGCAGAICRVSRWAKRQGYCKFNNLDDMEKPPAEPREVYIPPTEFKELLSHVRDQQFRNILLIGYHCGTRLKETRIVEAKHVDLEHGRWVFSIGESKGKRRKRCIYMTDECLEITKAMMDRNPNGALFRNTVGNPWTGTAVNSRFVNLKKKIGKKLFFYALRHSFATNMLKQGKSTAVVSELMGHTSTAMVSRVYSHLAQDPGFLRKQLEQ